MTFPSPPAALALALVLTLSTAGLAAVARVTPRWLLINESASAPRGLYVRSADQTVRLGRFVALAQPAMARPYLRSLGVPPDMRLLKRVAAVQGEAVCSRAGRLNTPRTAVAVLARDRRGVALPRWRGCRRLAADEVLVLGDTPASFDGRYFGPTARGQIDAVYQEVLRW